MRTIRLRTENVRHESLQEIAAYHTRASHLKSFGLDGANSQTAHPKLTNIHRTLIYDCIFFSNKQKIKFERGNIIQRHASIYHDQVSHRARANKNGIGWFFVPARGAALLNQQTNRNASSWCTHCCTCDHPVTDDASACDVELAARDCPLRPHAALRVPLRAALK